MERILSDKVLVIGALLAVIALGGSMPFALAERSEGCVESEINAEMQRELETINAALAETRALQEEIGRVSDPQRLRALELAAVANQSEVLLARLKLKQQVAAAKWLCDA